MATGKRMIPDFREDGYLPVGLHLATEAEFASRFGDVNPHRHMLMPRLHRWIELARDVGGRRFMVDGGFVTTKETPDDIDAVVLLPEDFDRQLADGDQAAVELERMFRRHRPAEIMPARDEVDWEDWQEFFSRTSEKDGRRKGIMEIGL
jgi:hypothetical protein